MNHWSIVYWVGESGDLPMEVWFETLTKEQLKSVAKELLLLEHCGSELRLPHSRALGKGLFELRERTFGYRIYYGFLPNKNILLLHAGDKTSQARDIRIAYSRLAKLNEVERYETKKL
jgi:putative addiction module killer protein